MMDYFDYVHHENGRAPLIIKVDQCRRRVRTLKEQLELEPSQELQEELQKAQAALQEAREELQAYDGPPPQRPVFKDVYGMKFDPHVPKNPSWMGKGRSVNRGRAQAVQADEG